MAPQQAGRPREVLIAISNYNLVLSGQLLCVLGMAPACEAFIACMHYLCCSTPCGTNAPGVCRMQTVKEVGVSNYVVVAIDTQLRDELAKKGANVYYKDIQARPGHVHLHAPFAVGPKQGRPCLGAWSA